MSKITGKINYKEVLKGDTGYTFEPHVTVDGILYWTNNGGLENPLPVNLHGKQGFIFIPHVDSEGNLSWSNTGELENPPTVNIKGDKGYFYTPHISQDGILTWSNNGDLENPQPFNISDLILNEVKESRVDTTGKTFTKLKERLDSDFKKLSESIKNNDTKDEVVQARTATTGENFTTLDDRIDHEVMRLREKIEVTMLEQEDKESHTIENTVDGMTTGVVVKGKTLQNLVDVRKMNLGDSSKEITFENDIIKFKKAYSNEITYLKVPFLSKPNTTYTIIYDVIKNNVEQPDESKYILYPDGVFGDFNSTMNTFPKNGQTGLNKFCLNTKYTLFGKFSLGFHRVNIGAEIWIKGLMILEGDWTNKPIPNYFEGIKSFGQQEDKISVLSSGKNRVNPHDFIETEFVIKFGNGLKNTKISALSNQIIYKKIIKGGSTISYKRKSLSVENESGTLLQLKFFDDTVMYTTVQKDRYDIPKDVKEIQFLNYCRGTHELTDFQIEEGSIESPAYQPYQSFKKDILLQELGFDEGLRGINSVSDELNSIRNVAIKRIGKREYREGDLLLDNVITDKVNTYYVLEESIETPLNENINLKTFNDKTYVSFENSINGTSSFKTPVNTNKLINDLKFEKEDLKEKFNNLTTEFENFKTYMIQTLPYKGE